MWKDPRAFDELWPGWGIIWVLVVILAPLTPLWFVDSPNCLKWSQVEVVGYRPRLSPFESFVQGRTLMVPIHKRKCLLWES
jgi:hypothetical protein